MKPPVILTWGRIGSAPPGDDWLGADELRTLAGLSHPKRRREWRAGRWIAKRLVVSELGLGPDQLARLQVMAGLEGAPEIWLDGRVVAGTLSLSHREDLVAAAWSDRALGIDLEVVEPRSDRFVRDYFTATEAERCFMVEPDIRDRLTVQIWSTKEAVLKCLRAGLRRDTRTVEVQLPHALPTDRWFDVQAHDHPTGREYRGWGGFRDRWSLTVMMESPAPSARPEFPPLV